MLAETEGVDMRREIRRGTPKELLERTEGFERHFGMSTPEFVRRFELDENVEGVHPHIAGLWYGAYCLLRRMRSLEVEQLEAMLA
jgi:hypothetical protein